VPHRNWHFRLDDIIESIRKIQEYTKNMDYEGFVQDGKTKDAVLANFMIIGEAVNHIPTDVTDNYPEIAWSQIKGLRNVIVHGYFQIDDKILWDTIRSDLDDLLFRVLRLKSNM
jgi:uncharacterized protein with HEPN domain